MSTRPLSAVIAAPAIWLIRGYQLVVSPMRPPTCRFYPSCSAYALTAIERFGVLRGSWLATAGCCGVTPGTRAGLTTCRNETRPNICPNHPPTRLDHDGDQLPIRLIPLQPA